MSGRFQRLAGLCVCVLAWLCGGCATNPWQAAARQSPFDRPVLAPPLVTPGKQLADLQSPRDSQRREGSRIAPAEGTSGVASASHERANSGLDAAAMTDVLAELQAVGAIDPAAQQQLLEDLRGTDPALWPQMLQIFRATLAYQQQLKQKDNQPTVLPVVAASQQGTQPAPRSPANTQPGHAAHVATASPPSGGTSIVAASATGHAPAAAHTAASGQFVGPNQPNQQGAATTPGVGVVSQGGASPSAATSSPQPQTTGVPPAPSAGAAAQATAHAVGQPPSAVAAPAGMTQAPVVGIPGTAAPTIAQVSAVGSLPDNRSVATGRAAVPVSASSGVLSATTGGEQSVPARLAANQDWRTLLSETIQRLEAELSGLPRTEADVRRRAALRMLYLAAGKTEQAARPIDGIPPAQQDFWSKEMYGLGVLLDTEGRPQLDQRAAEAATHLAEAHTRLGEMALLVVRNLAFCTEVTSFGVYKPFAEVKFSPGQEVLLYAEIDNFKSEATEDGYYTALRSSYQILNPQGHRVAEHEFSVTEDHCRNPRRDFFILYNLFMPKRIYPGRYTLQLTIEDTLSHKIGQSSIEFEIK